MPRRLARDCPAAAFRGGRSLEGEAKRGGVEAGLVGRRHGRGVEEKLRVKPVQRVDGEFHLRAVRPREDGRFKRPAGSLAPQADPEIGGRARLEIERAHLKERDVEYRVGLKLVQGERKAVGQAPAHDVDALPVGRQHIKAVADLGGVPDAQGDGLEGRGGGVPRCARVHAGGERERELGLVEAVIGQRQAALGKVFHEEAGVMVEEHQLIENPADGMRIGGPLGRPGDHPALLPLLDPDRFGKMAPGDFQRLDRGSLRAEDPAPAFFILPRDR